MRKSFRDKKVSKIAIRCPSQNNMFLFLQFYSDYPETFQAIQKLSGPSGKYPDYTETFQPIQKLSRLSRNFPRCPEIFRIIRKISSLSGNFLGYPETFWTIQLISTLSRNFPKGPESPHCNFRVYSQNLSERAKTFRMAMPPCYPGFWASGYHNARSRVNQSPS